MQNLHWGGGQGFDPSRMTPDALNDLLKSLSAGQAINNPGALAGHAEDARLQHGRGIQPHHVVR
jgi:hypothetical protein